MRPKKWDYVVSDDERKLYHYMEDVSTSQFWNERVLKGQELYPSLRATVIHDRKEAKLHYLTKGYRHAELQELFDGVGFD